MNKLQTIDELRKKYKYTYLEIAQMINCSKTYTWQLLTGKRRLSYEQAIILASIFNMKPDELFYTDFINEDITNKIKLVAERKKEMMKK